MTDTPEELPAIDEADDLVDHPDEVDKDEERRGLLMYRAVDDLDDDSNGLD
jgi:hypothetical protein